MNKKIKELQKAKQELVEIVSNFPKEKRGEILFDSWSLNEVLQHISGWNLQRIEELNKFSKGEEVEKIKDFDVFNKRMIEKRKHYNWEKTYKEFVNSCEELIKSFEKFPKELTNKKIWKDSNHTPLKWVQIDLSHWQDEHLPQIKKRIKLKQ